MPSSSKNPNAQAGSSRSRLWKASETILLGELNSEEEEDTHQKMKIPTVTGLREQPWMRSPSPPESWSEAEGALEDGSWPLKIVGEESELLTYPERCEVQWETWSRPDGTNTTWKDEYIDEDPLVIRRIRETWDKRERKRRKRLLEENHDLELCPGIDVHNNDTRHRAQAYNEKKATVLDLKDSFSAFYWKDKRKESRYLCEDSDMEVEPQEGEIRTSKRKSSSKTASNSSFRALSSATWSATSQSRTRVLSSTPSTTTRPTPAPSTASNLTSISRRSTPSDYRLFTPAASSITLASEPPSSPSQSPFADIPAGPPMSEKARGKQPMRSETLSPPLSPRPPRPRVSRRKALAAEWSLWGAPISFCNDVDDEDVPPLHPDFKYIERGYAYDTGLEHLAVDPGFLVGCSGHQSCSTKAIGRCECQGDTNFTDPNGRKLCAYDSKGLFRFNVPSGIEVLECTPNCECSTDCPNRVLQQERNIGLEVFKTLHRGWGVHAVKKVKRGKVLGMYTGLLIRRDHASDAMDYCFDLDGQENLDDELDAGMGDRYSVDSENTGNWTRFINHSCDPNLTVYEVVYDLPPGQGTPYLAYAALRDIPPGEEFTFNYNPKIDEDVQNPKKSVKFKKAANGKRIPVGRKECHCGAETCRGYF